MSRRVILSWLVVVVLCEAMWRSSEAAEGQGKFRILVTNDDGIHAEGLAAVAKELRTLDAEVVVVAPSEDRSGYSHAITYRDPFRAEEIRSESGELLGYSVNGTPADAALLGITGLQADRRPDVVVSGINRGENLGAVAHLSGTVGAAMEATTLGIPAIAISLGRAPKMDYAYAAQVAKSLVLLVRKNGLPLGTCRMSMFLHFQLAKSKVLSLFLNRTGVAVFFTSSARIFLASLIIYEDFLQSRPKLRPTATLAPSLVVR